MNKNDIYFGVLLLVGIAWIFVVPLIRQTLNRGGKFKKLGWETKDSNRGEERDL
jgi:hypothetical protein